MPPCEDEVGFYCGRSGYILYRRCHTDHVCFSLLPLLCGVTAGVLNHAGQVGCSSPHFLRLEAALLLSLPVVFRLRTLFSWGFRISLPCSVEVVCVCVCVCLCVCVFALPLHALHMSRMHRLSISLENIQGICSSSYAHDVTR